MVAPEFVVTLSYSGKNSSYCAPPDVFVGPDGSRYTDKYSDASVAWVMAASILIFFMKAGFLFVEVAFVSDDTQARRRVILAKYLDTCSSAMGFYLFGFGVSGSAPDPYLGEEQDFIEWFFRFTFASNTATILHGTLVGHTRKLRMVALFVYAFVMSAFIHPFIAREIWSTSGHFSPLKYCNGTLDRQTLTIKYIYEFEGPDKDMFFLDYAGSGAVHMLGGFGGLVLALLCKWDSRKLKKKMKKKELKQTPSKYRVQKGFTVTLGSKMEKAYQRSSHQGGDSIDEDNSVELGERRKDIPYRLAEEDSLPAAQPISQHAQATTGSDTIQVALPEQPDGEDLQEADFIVEMYPKESSAEFLEFAALGVLILWTTFFAFNCGTVETVDGKVHHSILGRIALNMCVAGGVGGIIATLVALFAQLRHRSRYINTNEIANGILGSLVAITGCCPFIPAERAIVVGLGAVFFYHLGVHAEFRWRIPDTARVFPVHGMCGIWGLLCTGLFGQSSLIRQTYENVCACQQLKMPESVNETSMLFAYQIVAILFILAWSIGSCGFVFCVLLVIPMQKVANATDAVIQWIDRWVSPCLTVLIACSKPPPQQRMQLRSGRRRIQNEENVEAGQGTTAVTFTSSFSSATVYEDEFIFLGGLLFTSEDEYGGKPARHSE